MSLEKTNLRSFIPPLGSTNISATAESSSKSAPEVIKVMKATSPVWATIQNIEFKKEYGRQYNILEAAPLNINIPATEDYNNFKKDFTAYTDTANIKCTWNDNTQSVIIPLDYMEVEAICNLKNIDYLHTKHLNAQDDPFEISMSGYGVIHNKSFYLHEICRKLLIIQAKKFNEDAAIYPVKLSSRKKYNPENLLFKLLDKYDGICIGEDHKDRAPKQILIDNMEKLYKKGVRAIFLEHLTYDTMKHFLVNPDTKEPPEHILEYLDLLDKGFSPWRLKKEPNPGFKDLVKEAMRCGIQVIPIDTTVSNSCGRELSTGITNSKERGLAMNYIATNIIRERLKTLDGQYIAMMGNHHLSTTEDGIKGVADLLGSPSVLIESGKASRLKLNLKNVYGVIEHLSAFLLVKQS